MERHQNLKNSLGNPEIIDNAPSTMQERMMKLEEEIVLIKSGAKITDISGEAIIKEIKVCLIFFLKSLFFQLTLIYCLLNLCEKLCLFETLVSQISFY